MTKLTTEEKKRVSDIRRSLRKFKRRKVDVSTWESVFFLAILKRAGIIR